MPAKRGSKPPAAWHPDLQSLVFQLQTASITTPRRFLGEWQKCAICEIQNRCDSKQLLSKAEEWYVDRIFKSLPAWTAQTLKLPRKSAPVEHITTDIGTNLANKKHSVTSSYITGDDWNLMACTLANVGTGMEERHLHVKSDTSTALCDTATTIDSSGC